MATLHSLRTLAIQWQIGNECNFKCDYCHSDYHDGSNPYISFELFNTVFNNIDKSTSHDSVIIEFQGGEPTLCLPVKDKLTEESSGRFKYLITTNACADLAWWQGAMHNLAGVTLAYHPGNIDNNHFLSVLDLLRISNIQYSITINAPPNKWAEAVNMYEKLQDDPHVVLKALFANHAKGNNIFLDYNKEQWDYYTAVNNIETETAQPLASQIQWVEQHLYNNYKGHLCWAGIDQIVIDYFGYVYRGWCHAHGSLGNIHTEPVQLDTKPKVCPYYICKNAFDREAKKSNNSWGL